MCDLYVAHCSLPVFLGLTKAFSTINLNTNYSLQIIPMNVDWNLYCAKKENTGKKKKLESFFFNDKI